jgi:hypothetical protein
LQNTSAAIFETTVNVAYGSEVLYRFIKGTDSEIVPSSCGVEFEQSTFRSLTVNNFTIDLDEVCFNECANCVTTSTTQISLNELKVYPNPFSDVITIEDLKPNSIFSICDVTGKEVLNITSNNQNRIIISTSNLSNGIYFIKELHSTQIPIKIVKAGN